MASNSETGHKKNVANFGKLVSFCTGYGTKYKPSRSNLSLEALNTMHSDSQNEILIVHNAVSAYKNAHAALKVAFKSFPTFVTRIINALKSSDTTTEMDDKAKSIGNKLQGRRVSAKLTEEEKKALSADGREPKEISTSHLSRDNRIDNFEALVTLLNTVPEYKPNEDDLKITALNTYLADLKAKDDAVTTTLTELSNARIARNEKFYGDNTGLVDIALDTKSYVKSVFGATSAQYKQVSGLEFRKIKD